MKPSIEEITAYADMKEQRGEAYGTVTYSKHEGQIRDWVFIRFHDTWKHKNGGRIHIDVGYVDEKYVNQWNVPDTTHLMLDKYTAPEFIEFVRVNRNKVIECLKKE